MFRKTYWMIGAACLMLLASCKGESYLNAIPKGCTALMAMDISSVGTAGTQQSEQGKTGEEMLQSVFGLDHLQQSGIDLVSKLYFFESPDGMFGAVADVSKESALQQWLASLQEQGTCKVLPERKGNRFAVLKDAWMLAYDSDKLLIMGPVVPSAHAQLMVQMARYMDQDEKQSMKDSPMMNRLSEMQSPMALVAQTAALPEALAAAFAIGAPKDADASQVLLAADMTVSDGSLVVHGETFSFNKSIQRSIDESLKSFSKMSGQFLQRIPLASMTWMANVEGSKFNSLLQQNRALKSLLTGANVSFDFNKVVNDIRGDMVVVADSMDAAVPRITMLAQKTDGQEYFASTDKSLKADVVFDSGQCALSNAQQSMLNEARCAMVVQLSQLGGSETVQLAKSLMAPFFGDINTIVYLME